MKFRIEEKEAFKLVGIMLTTTNEKRTGYREVPKLWEQVIKNENQRNELLSYMDIQPFGMIGASVYNIDSDDARKFEYYIGCASSKETPSNLKEYIVPACTWAIFPCKNSDVGKTEFNIVAKWQPTSEYELLNSGYETGYMKSLAPDLAVHGQGDDAEVWVAVKRKEK
ncbi:MAG: GyrI-like domain-containing protein [Coprobacillaceae bacterium]